MSVFSAMVGHTISYFCLLWELVTLCEALCYFSVPSDVRNVTLLRDALGTVCACMFTDAWQLQAS